MISHSERENHNYLEILFHLKKDNQLNRKYKLMINSSLVMRNNNKNHQPQVFS